MKKKFIMGAFAFLGLALASCSGKSNAYDVYGVDPEDSTVKKVGNIDLIFKEDSTIPYIPLDDGVKLMSLMRSTNLDDKKYNYSWKKENDAYIVSNERGATCTISSKDQTFTYSDFDEFVGLITDDQKPLSLMPKKSNLKAIQFKESTYTKGKSRTIDLKPYSRLDVYEKDGECYLPLSVYNSLLFNTTESVSLAYNTKNLFIIPGGSLTTDALGIPMPTLLGDKFREGVDIKTITDEFKEYNYQSIVMDFDNNYGLKDEKFVSFDTYLNDLGFKSDMLSNDPKTIDRATLSALTWLKDGHTALSDLSNYYEFGDNQIDKNKLNPEKQAWEKIGEDLKAAKEKAKIKDGISYMGDTAFIAFTNFTAIDNDALYQEKFDDSLALDDFTGPNDTPGFDFELPDLDLTPSDTATLFNQLFKDLTSDKYKNTIKNVVVDLTTNEGGSAESLLYALSTLVGKVTIDVVNPKTNAVNHQSYMADINADGKFDDKDKSLSELGFKIYILSSNATFSSGNALAVYAKLNNSKIVTLGDKTGGGPCAVRQFVTPIGSMISSSSTTVLSKPLDNKYVSIESGVAADHPLTYEQMVDRQYIVNTLKNW